MPTIQFSNGHTVQVSGNPTQKDIEDIATKLGFNTPPAASTHMFNPTNPNGQFTDPNAPQSAPQQDGFFKSMVKDPVKTLVVKPATRIAQAGVGLYGQATGNQELVDKSLQDTNVHVPLLGNYNIEGQKAGIKGVAQIAGDAAKSASYLYAPGGAEAAAGTQTVKQAALQGAKAGAISGGLYGAGNAAQQENPTDTGILKGGAAGAAIGGATGGVIGGATQAVTNKLPGALKGSATSDYEKILKPTTKANKQLTEKVAPGLADRGIIVTSKQGLEDKATQQIQNVGQQIEEKWAQLPPETQLHTTPALEAVQKLKDSFTITNNAGEKVVVNAQGYAHAQQVEQTLLDMGDSISAKSMRQAKQILDSSTYSPSNGVLKVQTATESSLANAQKTAADSFRGILNSANPDIAKLNAEYTFWKNVQTVISATNQRQTGRGAPLTEKIADIGAAIGGAEKGGLKGATISGLAMDLTYRAVTSPLWRSLGAVTKKSIANAMAKGDNKVLTNLLTKVIGNSTIKTKNP